MNIDSNHQHRLTEIVDQALVDLISIGAIKTEKLSGCNQTEIEEVIKSQRISRLPFIYAYFLVKFGKRSGKFMVGDQFFYPEVLDLKDIALRDIRSYGDFELPSDCFVFWTHDQIEHMWFDIHEDDPVVTYWEVNKQPEEVGKLSDVLLSFVNHFIEVKKKMPDIFDIP